jgi:hypothetical protein
VWALPGSQGGKEGRDWREGIGKGLLMGPRAGGGEGGGEGGDLRVLYMDLRDVPGGEEAEEGEEDDGGLGREGGREGGRGGWEGMAKEGSRGWGG